MEVGRNKTQELIMQSLYIALTYANMNEQVDIPSVMEGVFKKPFDDIDMFSKGVVIKSIAHISEIVPEIEKHLKNWKWNRLARLSQAILLMSYTHYHYFLEDANKAIIIDVAISLAKKYLDANDYKFINGVLDKVL